jgi:hypothetical protein
MAHSLWVSFAIRNAERSPAPSNHIFFMAAPMAYRSQSPLRTSQKFASVSLIARRLNTLAESAILVVIFFDGRFIDKTLDSKRPEVIPSTQVFTLTSHR